MRMKKWMNRFWVDLEEVKKLILNGRPFPIKGWQFYVDENDAVVVLGEMAMIEPKPVHCPGCLCGYDPFWIREHHRKYPDALCPICYDEGIHNPLISLVLKRVREAPQIDSSGASPVRSRKGPNPDPAYRGV